MTVCFVCKHLPKCPIVRIIIRELQKSFDGVAQCEKFSHEQSPEKLAKFAARMVQAAVKAKLCKTGKITWEQGRVNITTEPQITGEELLVNLFEGPGGESWQKSAERN